MATHSMEQSAIFDELESVRELVEKYEGASERMKQAADISMGTDRKMFIAKAILTDRIAMSLKNVEAQLMNWKGIIS